MVRGPKVPRIRIWKARDIVEKAEYISTKVEITSKFYLFSGQNRDWIRELQVSDISRMP